MITNLSILDRSGDIKLTWDSSDPEQLAKARAEVVELKAMGYSFFLLDGTPADEVSAGGGALVVKKLTTDEVVGAVEATPAETLADAVEETTPKRRGRPRKDAAVSTPESRKVVAFRPVAGG